MSEQEDGVSEEDRAFRAPDEPSAGAESVEQRIARERAEHKQWVENEAAERWKSLQVLAGEATYVETLVPADGGNDPEVMKEVLRKREEYLTGRYEFLRKSGMPDLASLQRPPEFGDSADGIQRARKENDRLRDRVHHEIQAIESETAAIRQALAANTVEALRRPFADTIDAPRRASPSRSEIIGNAKNAAELNLYAAHPQMREDFRHRTVGFAMAAEDHGDYVSAIDVLDAAGLMPDAKDDLLKNLDRAEKHGVNVDEYRRRIESLTKE